jgi:hypothetical protein
LNSVNFPLCRRRTKAYFKKTFVVVVIVVVVVVIIIIVVVGTIETYYFLGPKLRFETGN